MKHKSNGSTVRTLYTFAVYLVIICMLMAFLPQTSFADSNAQHWNIMIVVDGTAAFHSSDPDGLRIEAISSFLDTLWNRGDYVGAIVSQVLYTGNNAKYNDAIRLDTWKDGAIELAGNKQNLKSQINRYATSAKDEFNTDRDLASAILLAEERIEEACASNGLPGAIFVVANGVSNQSGTNKTKYENNKANAINLIKSNGHKIGAVYMNTTDQRQTELRDIVTSANGLLPGDLEVANYYYEISSPEKFGTAFDGFLKVLGISVPETKDIFVKTGTSNFSIPGTGVEELNFRFRTTDGSEIPSGARIDISRPGGKELTRDEMNSIESVGVIDEKTYKNYKITSPEGGDWTVKVTLPDNCGTPVEFHRIYNTYIEAGMNVTPAAADLRANSTATVNAFLIKDGAELNDTQAYLGYKCKIVLTDRETGEGKVYEVPQGKSGEFTTDISLDYYGKYSAKAVFYCDEFFTASEPELWDLTNRTPSIDAPAVRTYDCSIISNDKQTIDCSEYVSDDEDSVLSYFISDTTTFNIDALSIDGSQITIDPYRTASGETETGIISVRAVDSQGTFSILDIPVTINVADIRAVMETDPVNEKLHANSNVNISCFFTENGAKITDAGAYNDYACRIVLTDDATGEQKVYAAPQLNDGTFATDISLDYYGSYTACAELYSSEFSALSEPQLWNLTNRIPEISAPGLQTIDCSIFNNEKQSIDCSLYAKDAEDLELTYRLNSDATSFSMDALSMDGSLLIIDPYRATDGQTETGNISIRAEDSQGTASILNIPVMINVAEVKGVLETEPTIDKLHAKLENGITVYSYLAENGSRIEDKLYDGYKCYLVIRDAETQEVIDKKELEKDDSGNRSVKVFIDDYKVFEAYTYFEDEYAIPSPLQTWDLTNRAPVCRDYGEETYSPLFVKYVTELLGYTYELPVSDFVDDVEDDLSSLKIWVDNVSDDMVSITEDNQFIKINPDVFKGGDIVVKVKDTGGDVSEFVIPYLLQDWTQWVLIGAGVLLLIIIIIIICAIKKKNSIFPRGKCKVEFELFDENDNEKTLNIELSPPGNGFPRKTNLYNMISTDMRRDGGSMRQECDSAKLAFREAERFIEDLGAELKKVEVSCVNSRQKGVGKVGKVKVAFGKDSTVLYNGSKKVLPGGKAFTISYYNSVKTDFGYDSGYGSDSAEDPYDTY